MQKLNYGYTKDKVSNVCLGAMLMGTALGKKDSFQVLDNYADIGGNFIDTANCYAWWLGKGEFTGNESENIIGDWMHERKNRDKIFLATKFGARLDNLATIRDKDGNVNYDQVKYEGNSARTIRKAIENSLLRLKTDYIDLYYIHVDDRSVPLEETLETLSQLVKEGKVKNIGCSNFRTWRLANSRLLSKQNGWPLISAIEQEYTYIHPTAGADRGIVVHADDELFDYIKSNPDMMMVAYSPLLKGVYESEEKCKSYYGWDSFDNGANRERIQLILNMAKELGISGNQLVLAWILHQDPKIIPIIGFSKVSQYEHNIAALNIKLTPEQLTILNRGRV